MKIPFYLRFWLPGTHLTILITAQKISIQILSRYIHASLLSTYAPRIHPLRIYMPRRTYASRSIRHERLTIEPLNYTVYAISRLTELSARCVYMHYVPVLRVAFIRKSLAIVRTSGHVSFVTSAGAWFMRARRLYRRERERERERPWSRFESGVNGCSIVVLSGRLQNVIKNGWCWVFFFLMK